MSANALNSSPATVEEIFASPEEKTRIALLRLHRVEIAFKLLFDSPISNALFESQLIKILDFLENKVMPILDCEYIKIAPEKVRVDAASVTTVITNYLEIIRTLG